MYPSEFLDIHNRLNSLIDEHRLDPSNRSELKIAHQLLKEEIGEDLYDEFLFELDDCCQVNSSYD